MTTPEASVENTETPLIEFPIAESGTIQRFRSIDELQQWLMRENTFWSELLQPAIALDGQVGNIMNWQLYQRDQIVSAVSELAGQASSLSRDELRGRLGKVRGWLEERYGNRRAIPSDSPKAKYVAKIAEGDHVVAAHALWALMGHDPHSSSRQGLAVRGQIMAAMYFAGYTDLPTSHADAWADVYKALTAEHENLRQSAGAMADRFRSLDQQVSELHTQQQSNFDATQTERQVRFDAVLDEHAQKMATIAKTFEEDLSLRSAVQYLTEKATTHRKLSIGFGIAALLVAAALGSLAIWLGTTVFAEESKISSAKIVVAVLGGTLVFWLLRILVRVFLSNLHLATDMRTRATFVHTYLALIAEGGAIKDEDRKLVIGLVFRPTTDGLVRDDAAPPGLWDLLSRGVGGRGS